jgi:2,3-bisphosphoglycerate-independent phosphoglycerate mutase
LLWAAKESGLKDVYLHLFTDGRDSSPTAALQIIAQIEYKITSLGIGKIASVMGRYWSMDRDRRWERTSRAYHSLVCGQGNLTTNARDLIQVSYSKNITDEFIEPTVISSDGKTLVTIKDNDSVIFFNFRPDRARQLTESFIEADFRGFTRERVPKNLFFVCMTEYDSTFAAPVAFPHQKITEPLSRVISNYSLKQLHIGESEKYAHVTYFFNGGLEEPFLMEDRIHIPSPKVATYDLKPEMSALEIANYVISKLKQNAYDFYVVNFANADMVAHTGSISATIKAVETLDTCLKQIGREVLFKNGAMVVTADHGNAEMMINPQTGSADTEHSTNKVPFIVVANEFAHSSTLQFPSGILADVAPTILSLMGIPKPGTMFGQDLLNIRVEVSTSSTI